MTQIAENLKDPAWWFSAFFVAIIASIAAGFAKDYIQNWFSGLSTKARDQQARRLKQRELLLAALEENEGFLILSMLRALALLVLMMATITLFLLSPMWAELVSNWCLFVSIDPTCSKAYSSKLLSLFASVVFGSTAAFGSFRAMATTRIVMEGFRRYRRKRGFPILR